MLFAAVLREYTAHGLHLQHEDLKEMLIAEAKKGKSSCVKVLSTLEPDIVIWLAEQGVSVTVKPCDDSSDDNPTVWTYIFKWDT